MHSRVKGINEIQATRADLEKKENQTALNTSERKNDEVGIRVSTLRSNEICALFRFHKSSFVLRLSVETFESISSVSLCSSSPCKVCPSGVSQFKGSFQRWGEALSWHRLL